MKTRTGKCPARRPKGARAAFSLIEIMAAVSLLAMIIVGLLAMFYQVQRAFRAGMAQVDVMEGGRGAMSILTRELQSMRPTQVDDTMNLLITPSDLLLRSPDALTTQQLPSGATRENYLRDLCFITRENDEWVATAYRVRHAASGVGTLYRMEVRRTNDSLPDLSARVLADLSWLVSTSRVDHTNFHQVVDGVVHLWVMPYTTNGMISSLNEFHLSGQATASYGFTNRVLPAYVDLELAVLEPSAVEKFRARLVPGNPNPTARATEYLSRQVGRTHVFRQRVAIRAGTSARSD